MGIASNITDAVVTTTYENIPADAIDYAKLMGLVCIGASLAGTFRGGGGMIRTFRVMADEAVFQVRSDRRSYPPYGLKGGQPAANSAVIANPGTADEVLLPTKFVMNFKRGDVLSLRMPGGGGWGDPLKRDPEMVLQDVTEGRITLQRAQLVYGVAIDQSTYQIDWVDTRKLREM